MIVIMKGKLVNLHYN